MEQISGTKLMEENLELEHAAVIDVGCGDGWVCRFLAEKGAHVTGIEVSPKQLAHARSIPAVADEHYMQGIAEDLPVRSGTADIVVFYNSLHHVDAMGLPWALKEAARVLKPGGVLYISEPMAEGDYFDLMRPAHDETVARHLANEILRRGPEFKLRVEKQIFHLDRVRFPDFQAFHDRITSINPHTRNRFDEMEDEFRANFKLLGEQDEDGWSFEQPMRVTIMRRS